MIRHIVLIALLLAPMMGFAHSGGHNHEEKADKPTAVEKAKAVIQRLISKGKLGKSWHKASLESASLKVFNGHTEWVVVHFNNKVKEEAKQRLYIFLSEGGSYIAANYTGQ